MNRFTRHSEIEEFDHATDVLVLGFGAAGGVSAIEAHDTGADVTIVEKQSETDYCSNTRMSGGAYHSPRKAADRDALKEYALAMFSGNNLPWKLEGELPEEIAEGLAEAWAEYAPENRDWMCSLDPEYDAVEFSPGGGGGAAFPQFPGAQESKYRNVWSTYSGKIENTYRSQEDDPKAKKESGEAFFTCLLHGVTDRNIDVHWGTAAKEFIVDSDHTVTGAIVEQEGTKLAYEAESTVLTTGGYEYNKKLRRNFLDGPGVEGWAFYGSDANTGDGIVMGMNIGTALSHVSDAASRLITAIPVRKHGLKVGLQTSSVGRPHGIVVDNYGERFTAERKITQNPSRYFFYKSAMGFDIEELSYPRVPSWFVFDETMRQERPVVNTRNTDYHNLPWGQDNSEAIERGWILCGETLDELAAEIHSHSDNHQRMVADTLIETVESYNHYCEKGIDVEFGSDPDNMGTVQTPPFYAIPLYPGGPNTKGGVDANASREVLDWNRDPIPNLYSAGEISSVFKFVYQGGGNLAESIVFGRIAGENAAETATESS